MKYKWIIYILGTITCIGFTQANDCNLIAGDNFEGAIMITKKFSSVMPEEAFTKALNNLKNYCCSKKKISCSQEEIDAIPKEQLYPKSIFLFDHLVDVAMRRLDGIEQLAYGLTELDPVGTAWRVYITEAASNINGKSAKNIQEQYTNYRAIDKKNINDLEKVKKNYNSENLTLGEKYITLCTVMKDVYEKIQKNHIDIENYQDIDYFSLCKSMVNARRNREQSYVKMIMSKQSALLLEKTTKAYTKSYFVEDKLMNLWELIVKVKDIFQTIVQQAAVSKTCSK